MRHFVDLYAVFPKRPRAVSGNSKEIAWSDYYISDGEKLGSFQSFGVMPPAHMLVERAREEIAGRLGTWAGPAVELAKPLLRYLVDRVLSRALVFATIMEDLPYPDNQVFLSRGASEVPMIAIRYRIRDADGRRIVRFRTGLSMC